MPLLGFRRTCGVVASVLVGILAVKMLTAQQPAQFGGAYSELDTRRQQLVDDWVRRFIKISESVLHLSHVRSSDVKV